MAIRDRNIRRREFLTGLFRDRNEPLAASGRSDPTRVAAASGRRLGSQELPDREGDMDRILEAMNDLTGIQEP